MMTALKLNELNQKFYTDNAPSFAATRTAPWAGWERLLGKTSVPTALLDVAGGNLRFERFLESIYPGAVPRFYCLDFCPDLVPHNFEVDYQNIDLVDMLVRGESVVEAMRAPQCDLVVSFGFMHHIPGIEARRRLMEALCAKTVSDGYLCVSLWRFMDEKRIAEKARRSTERALENLDLKLDKGDYLLGWQDTKESWRYCHSFSDEEIDDLREILSVGFDVVDEYRADGKSGRANTYLTAKKR